MGQMTLSVVEARRVVIGVVEQGHRSGARAVALALGDPHGNYFMLECPPARARQIAASLLNKADSVEES